MSCSCGSPQNSKPPAIPTDICFFDPITHGRSCYPILSEPNDPNSGRIEESAENWEIYRGENGEVTRAFSIKGDPLEYRVITKKRKKTMIFSRSNKVIFKINSKISKKRGCMGAPKITVEFKGKKTSSKITSEAKGFDEIRISRQINNDNDSMVLRSTDPVPVRRLHRKKPILSKKALKTLAPFEPIMKIVSATYWRHVQTRATSLSLANPTDAGELASFWRGVCRFAVGASTVGIGLICCGALALVGCVVCGSIAGGAGAVAMEDC